MKKCPYCGKENDDRNTVCDKCFAGIPVEKQEEKPVKKAEKKPNKE